MNETRIMITLLRVYILRNWEFGSALSKLRNFREGVEHPNPSALGTPLSVDSCFLLNYLNSYGCEGSAVTL
jgi:hypothetical protein